MAIGGQPVRDTHRVVPIGQLPIPARMSRQTDSTAQRRRTETGGAARPTRPELERFP